LKFVPGAGIQGEVTIEVTVLTNTGRTVIYRQESREGEFIVPWYHRWAGPRCACDRPLPRPLKREEITGPGREREAGTCSDVRVIAWIGFLPVAMASSLAKICSLR